MVAITSESIPLNKSGRVERMVIARVAYVLFAPRSRLITCQMTDVSGNTDALIDVKSSTFIESEIALTERVFARASRTLSSGTST